MTTSSIIRAAFLAVVLALPGRAAAQTTGPWTLTVYLGGLAGGPSGHVESAMREGGYTSPFGGCGLFGCFPESPSPASYTHANPILIGLLRRPARRLGFELFVDQGARWSTEGRSSSRIVRTSYGGTFGAATATLHAGRFRVGLGPMHFRGWLNYMDGSDGSGDDQRFTQVGVLGTAGGEVALGSRFVLSGIAQRRALPHHGIRESSTAPGVAPFEANFSHSYFAVGAGVRF